jgi:hypothetical protein
MKNAVRLASVDDEGNLYQHVGRHAGQLVLTAFYDVGGSERLADWADKNYGEFATKLLPKIIAKPHEHNISEGVEDLLERLDASDRADVVEGSHRFIDEEA